MAQNGEFAKKVKAEQANGDFAKKIKAQQANVTLRESESKEVELSTGKLKIRKAILTLCAAGSVLGLATTVFGAANIAAIAIRPEFNIISLETLSWGLTTAAGFWLTKKCLPTTIRNTPKFKSKFDDLKEDVTSIRKSIK